MVRRINSRRGLFISLWRSPRAWFSGLIFLLGLYSLIGGEFYPQWPALGQFMPLWAYAILGLGLLWVATFGTAYRYYPLNTAAINCRNSKVVAPSPDGGVFYSQKEERWLGSQSPCLVPNCPSRFNFDLWAGLFVAVRCWAWKKTKY
jgi:hypothetical protein